MSRSVAIAAISVAVALIGIHGGAPLWSAQLLLLVGMGALVVLFLLGDSGLDVGAALTLVGATSIAVLVLKMGGGRGTLLAIGIVISLAMSLSQLYINRIDHIDRSTYDVRLLSLLGLGIGSLGVLSSQG